jgi:hypothetical protein
MYSILECVWGLLEVSGLRKQVPTQLGPSLLLLTHTTDSCNTAHVHSYLPSHTCAQQCQHGNAENGLVHGDDLKWLPEESLRAQGMDKQLMSEEN